ncbi:MAG: hypothetical protein V7605_437 [Acidimicrobiaceae bacterium]|jgi:hypothetical protein
MVGFVVAVGLWAFRPWTSAVSLPAVDNKTPQATFRCGAPFGSASVDPSNGLARSSDLPHAPCTSRGARRVLAVLDVILGSALVVVLVTVGRPQPATEVDSNI